MFGYPGDGINGVFGALNRAAGQMEFIQARHEEMAAFMATAYAKFSGELGVCIATSGPGVSNLTTGLATANSEGDPVVALGGAVATDEALKQIHQTMDAVSIMKPVTKFSATVGASRPSPRVPG